MLCFCLKGGSYFEDNDEGVSYYKVMHFHLLTVMSFTIKYICDSLEEIKPSRPTNTNTKNRNYKIPKYLGKMFAEEHLRFIVIDEILLNGKYILC